VRVSPWARPAGSTAELSSDTQIVDAASLDSLETMLREGDGGDTLSGWPWAGDLPAELADADRPTVTFNADQTVVVADTAVAPQAPLAATRVASAAPVAPADRRALDRAEARRARAWGALAGVVVLAAVVARVATGDAATGPTDAGSPTEPAPAARLGPAVDPPSLADDAGPSAAPEAAAASDANDASDASDANDANDANDADAGSPSTTKRPKAVARLTPPPPGTSLAKQVDWLDLNCARRVPCAAKVVEQRKGLPEADVATVRAFPDKVDSCVRACLR
jgi:hypothetical protein